MILHAPDEGFAREYERLMNEIIPLLTTASSDVTFNVLSSLLVFRVLRAVDPIAEFDRISAQMKEALRRNLEAKRARAH
jgi:hypothetical protein